MGLQRPLGEGQRPCLPQLLESGADGVQPHRDVATRPLVAQRHRVHGVVQGLEVEVLHHAHHGCEAGLAAIVVAQPPSEDVGELAVSQRPDRRPVEEHLVVLPGPGPGARMDQVVSRQQRDAEQVRETGVGAGDPHRRVPPICPDEGARLYHRCPRRLTHPQRLRDRFLAQQPLDEQLLLLLHAREGDLHHRHLIGVETKISAAHKLELPLHRGRRRDQRCGDGELGHHEEPTRSGPSRVTRPAPGHGEGRVGAGQHSRRQTDEGQRRQTRPGQQIHVKVHAEVGAEGRGHHPGQRHGGGQGQQAEHQCLGQGLQRQVPARGADCPADPQFCAPAYRLCRRQVGEVGACQQQDEAADRRQQEHPVGAAGVGQVRARRPVAVKADVGHRLQGEATGFQLLPLVHAQIALDGRQRSPHDVAGQHTRGQHDVGRVPVAPVVVVFEVEALPGQHRSVADERVEPQVAGRRDLDHTGDLQGDALVPLDRLAHDIDPAVDAARQVRRQHHGEGRLQRRARIAAEEPEGEYAKEVLVRKGHRLIGAPIPAAQQRPECGEVARHSLDTGHLLAQQRHQRTRRQRCLVQHDAVSPWRRRMMPVEGQLQGDVAQHQEAARHADGQAADADQGVQWLAPEPTKRRLQKAEYHVEENPLRAESGDLTLAGTLPCHRHLPERKRPPR